MLQLFRNIVNNNKESPIKKCKSRQLSLIKTPCNVKHKTCSQKKEAFCMYTGIENITDILKTDKEFNKKFNIIRMICERNDRAIYIIEMKNKKYVLKVKLISSNENVEVQIHKILKKKKNNYIIKFIDYGKTELYQYFIYEYFDGVTLCDYLQDRCFELSGTDIKEIFIKIVNAVKFLHSLNIIHCDLKLDNILIDLKKKIKIIDFDLSKICKDEYMAENIFGTMQYIAPESYDLYIYSKKSDVWELGMILYILVTKTFPYDSDFPLINSNDNMYRRNEFRHPNLFEVKEKVKKFNYDKNIIKLIKLMLTFEDDKRILIDDILKFKW